MDAAATQSIHQVAVNPAVSSTKQSLDPSDLLVIPANLPQSKNAAILFEMVSEYEWMCIASRSDGRLL
jgi:hypothetical protein